MTDFLDSWHGSSACGLCERLACIPDLWADAHLKWALRNGEEMWE